MLNYYFGIETSEAEELSKDSERLTFYTGIKEHYLIREAEHPSVMRFNLDGSHYVAYLDDLEYHMQKFTRNKSIADLQRYLKSFSNQETPFFRETVPCHINN